MPIPRWTELLGNLEHWIRKEVPDSYSVKHVPLKLLAELDQEVSRIFPLGSPGEDGKNLPPQQEQGSIHTLKQAEVSLIELIEQPCPVCAYCGMLLRTKKTGHNEYIVDHNKFTKDCPNDFRMWKITAGVVKVRSTAFVPDFARAFENQT
jgi:hypothetical protein